MANPGIPSSAIPKGEDWVPRALKDIEIQIRELTPSIARSIQPTVDRLDAADIANAAQDATLAANVAGIAANVASINTLISQVVLPQSIWLQTSNYALTTSYATILTSTLTTPAGYTSALVSIVGQASCYNLHTTGGSNSAGGDYVHGRPFIGASVGTSLGTILLGSGGFAYDVTPMTVVLTGLSGGGTFAVGLSGRSVYAAMAADATNQATVSGSILWLR